MLDLNPRVERVSPVSTMHIGFMSSSCPINDLHVAWFGMRDASLKVAKGDEQRATVYAQFARVEESK